MLITSNIYERVVKITCPDGRIGTGTVVERGDQTFVVTARHVLPEKPGDPFKVANRFSRWDTTVSCLPGVHPEADVAVIRVPPQFARPSSPIVLDNDHVPFSQDVFFLGWPFGLALQQEGVDQLPFVKKATVSARQSSKAGPGIWFLDGLINPGFSGGPVVLMKSTTEPPQFFAIVATYLQEVSRVVFGGMPSDDAIVMANTGIIQAFEITHALEALDKAVPAVGPY